MKRRHFIKKSAIASTAIPLTGLGLSSFNSKSKVITILHTNDVHSHIVPFGANHSRNANRGGFARRATLVEAIRQQNPNTLLLDAGDIFQGTPYFNYYGGELEFKLMSKLKYDAATIGNHDFDNGINGLYKQLPHAAFKFVSANYDFTNTIMNTHVKPYEIFMKDDIKIGVFGLGIKLEGLVEKQLYKETKYLNPIDIAKDITQTLKNELHCDLIICLSHLGYFYKKNPDAISDIVLARKTSNIDLIIGGHTHTFLPKPTIEKNEKGKSVLINQVGCYGLNLGRIDFHFSKDSSLTTQGTTIVV